MHELFWDTETRSAVSLRSSGAWRYAGDPTTDVLCICYAVDDGDIEVWLPGQPLPAPFLEAASNSDRWRSIAHNTQFDHAVLDRVLVPRYGFAPIPVEAQHCSMALALANGYPAELDRLAQALELEYSKDRDGAKLMREMSRPRKARKGEDRKALHWVDDPEKLQRLIIYCCQDVCVARAIWRHPKLKHLSDLERRVQVLDAIINRRGVRADRDLAEAARDMSRQERVRINAALADLTAGAIDSVDQVQRIRTAVNACGHQMESLGKRSVAAVLAGDPDDLVRQLLELRRAGARASTRKYERILAYADDRDDRMRGTVRFYGSATGRWSGQGPQLQKPAISMAGMRGCSPPPRQARPNSAPIFEGKSRTSCRLAKALIASPCPIPYSTAVGSWCSIRTSDTAVPSMPILMVCLIHSQLSGSMPIFRPSHPIPTGIWKVGICLLTQWMSSDPTGETVQK